jgi:hypothetical protein
MVLPLDVDEIWIDNRQVRISPPAPQSITLKPGEALILHKNTAAAGIRVPFTRRLDGHKASVALIYDGNTHGAMRLTVTHHTASAQRQKAGAAFWIHVDGELNSDAFDLWRKRFVAAATSITNTSTNLTVTVAGNRGALSLTVPQTDAPGIKRLPESTRAILEYNGEDIGGNILNRIEWLDERAHQYAGIPIHLPEIQRAYFKAEHGKIMPPLVLSTDSSNTTYTWMPGREGARGGSDLGTITWRISIPKSGHYYLWGRIIAPTPDDDSFYVSAYTSNEMLIAQSEWHTSRSQTWKWMPVRLNRAQAATPFVLPKGDIFLEFRVREDGTKIDRLYITPDANDHPVDIQPDLRGNIDFNSDGITNFADFLQFAHAFGSQKGMASYNPAIDLNSSGVIDFHDFVLFVNTFTQSVA